MLQKKTLISFSLHFLALFLFSSCGSITAQTADNTSPTLDTSLAEGDSQVFIFASDYSSSGQLYTASLISDETSLANSGVTLLGTEAHISYQGDLLYVLNAGGSYNSVSTDNLQIIDPADSFKTTEQFSTGNGTNPSDVVVDGTSAYISLYNPTADSNNVDDSGNPGDVILMNLASGNITKRFSFYDYLNNDGDRNAGAYKMVVADDILYVILQDLESNTYDANAVGKIGMIDMNTQEVLGVITLSGRNPSSMALSSDNQYLFVATSNDYLYNTNYSGLQKINLSTRASVLTIHDSVLGGYIESLQASDSGVFAVVSKYNTTSFTFYSKIEYFPQSINSSGDINEFKAYGNDIRALFVQNNVLWVCYRAISTSTGTDDPAIVAYDANTTLQLGSTLTPAAAGISITGQ